MAKIYMFNDKSHAFSVLYDQLKDKYEIIVKDVDPHGNLLQWFTQVDQQWVSHLHFTADQLRANKEELRKEVEKVERVGFKNKVFLDFEGMTDSYLDELFRHIKQDQPPKFDVIKAEGEKKQAILEKQMGEVLDKNVEISETERNEVDNAKVNQLDSRDNFIARRVDPDDEMKEIDKDLEELNPKPYKTIPGKQRKKRKLW